MAWQLPTLKQWTSWSLARAAVPGWEAAYWLLYHAGIRTFDAAAAKTEAELLRISKLGPVRVAAIREALAAHGYELRAAS